MKEWSQKRFEPKPAQKTQCKTIVSNYREGQCLFPAWKDGFCRRHHPETHVATLIRQLHRHQKAATDILIELGKLGVKPLKDEGVDERKTWHPLAPKEESKNKFPVCK